MRSPNLTELTVPVYGWNRKAVLDQLFLVSNYWGEGGQQLRSLLLTSHGSEGRHYSRDSPEDVRLSVLSGLYQKTVALQFNAFWQRIMTRATMVQFWAGYLQEIRVRQSEYTSSQETQLTFRAKYVGQSRAEIESTVALEIRARVSGILFNAGMSATARTVDKVEASKVRQVTKQLRQMKRWHHIASVVGWAGIVLSDWMRLYWVNEANNEQFKRFVGFYATRRPTILRMLDKYWDDAPELLRLSGSKLTRQPWLMDLRYSRTW